MATLTPVSATQTGAITYAAASAGGDAVSMGTRTTAALVVRNASGSAVTVTIAGAVPCNQGSTHNVVQSCPAGADTEINVPSYTINPATGLSAVTYSAVTSVTVAVIAN